MDNAATVDDKVNCLMAATKASEIVNEMMGFDSLSRKHETTNVKIHTEISNNVVPIRR